MADRFDAGRRIRQAAARVAGPVAIALAATVAVVATLAPEVGGPGITCDEWYHVATGKRLVMALRHQGWAFFSPDNIARNFPWSPKGPPVHPPLGNWALGFAHHLFDVARDDPTTVSILPARFAPALAFGLLVLLVGIWACSADGPIAGSAAAAGVVLVPRVFGHAHLAALDTLTALAFVAAVLAAAQAEAKGRVWRYALAGVVWGLAMLTRIHGLLLAPPVVVWLVWRLRRKAVLPVLAWGSSGLATLYIGWPWLWLAPVANFRQFLGTATDRQPIHVFYAGRVWADQQAPWHYPLVMFLAVLPLGLLVLGVLGLWAKHSSWRAERRSAKPPLPLGGIRGEGPKGGRLAKTPSSQPFPKGAGRLPPTALETLSQPGYWLALGTLLFVLLVFAWPGTPVYDGVRLFLMVFPLWAVFVGAGAKWLAEHQVWRGLKATYRLTAVGIFVALQGAGLVVYHPCQLSHYGLQVGGLRGAERLGFEVSYWGDAVTESLLAEAARRSPGGVLVFGPNLAPFQAPAVAGSSPALVENQVALVSWQRTWVQPPPECRYGVFYHRRADLGSIPAQVWSSPVVAEVNRQGVWLARLVVLPNRPTTAGRPARPE